MAKVSGPLMSYRAAGSVGAVVFQNHSLNQYAHASSRPTRSQTKSANARRALVHDIARNWNLRTAAQRALWDAVASQGRTGYQQFLVCNTARILEGAAFVNVPSSPAIYPAEKQLLCRWNAGANPTFTATQGPGAFSRAIIVLRYMPLMHHRTVRTRQATRFRQVWTSGTGTGTSVSLRPARAVLLEATLMPDRGAGDVHRSACILWDDQTIIPVEASYPLHHWTHI